MSTSEAILEKVRALPPEKQAEVLHFAEALADETAKQGAGGSSLRRFASLKIEGPVNASVHFHEYLYGENARHGK